MHVVDYILEVQCADRNQALMARIVLNTLVDAKCYPVDVSELRFLSPYNRALTTAFEEWVFSHGDFDLSGFAMMALRGLAKGSDYSNDLSG